MPTFLFNDIYDIFIANDKYVKLSDALVERCTDNQIEDISEISNYGKMIIPFRQLIKQYEYVGTSSYTESDYGSNTKCICGVSISKCFLIRNKHTKCEFLIGSVCQKHWNDEDDNDEIIYRCQFCKRRKSNEQDCKNCKGKQKIKEICNKWKNFSHSKRCNRENKILKILDHWKNLVENKKQIFRNIIRKWKNKKLEKQKLEREIRFMKEDEINFGKYKGMSYYDLLTKTTYCDYILNNFDDNYRNKQLKDKIINYKKILSRNYILNKGHI
jgi:hypothetical protein